MPSSSSFLGKGFAFPLNVTDTRNFEISVLEKSVKESIYIILSTSKGERVMRPDFGCEINEMVFAPNNSHTHNNIAHYIEEALIRWEPRIILEKVDVFASPDDDSKIEIVINYKIRSINNAFNMVYPFYLERGEHDTQSQFR